MWRRMIGVLLLWSLFIVSFPVYAQECSAQDLEAWQTQANNDYDLENYEAAIDGYTCMIEISDEQDAYAYQWRAVAKSILGQSEDALVDINRSIEIDTTRGTAYRSRGDIYLDFDLYQLAIEDYTTAINKDHRTTGTYNNRGYAYDKLEDYANAERDFRSAVRINSEYGLGYSNLGEMNFYNGDLEQAIANYELGIEYSDGIYLAYPHRNLGSVSYMNQDYMGAIEHYTNAIEAYPEYADIYLLRAEAYRAIESPNAYADYQRYIQNIQTEIIDLERTSIETTVELSEGIIYRDTYPISQEGYHLEVTVESVEGEVDPLVLILNASGSPVMGDDDSGSDEDAAVRFPIDPQEGPYTILVTHGTQGDTGEVIIRRQRVPNLLKRGIRAEVYAIDNEGSGVLNLREYPNPGFGIVDRLPSGALVTVLNGPFKDRNYVWWEVETEAGLTGWVAEHIGGIQTLYAAIEVGGEIQTNVTELNMRENPTTDSRRLGVLLRGQSVPVVDGPIVAEGFRWWKVEAFDTEGWVVERVNDNRAVVALMESP